MPTLIVHDTDLTVHLSPMEKLAAFRGDVTLPIDAVVAVTARDDGWASLRGRRAPGTGIPGVIAYGVRRYVGGKDFAAVLGKRRAIEVDLDPDRSPFHRLTLTVPDVERAVHEISAAAHL